MDLQSPISQIQKSTYVRYRRPKGGQCASGSIHTYVDARLDKFDHKKRMGSQEDLAQVNKQAMIIGIDRKWLLLCLEI